MKALIRLYKKYLGASMDEIYTPLRKKQGYFMGHNEMYQRDLRSAVRFIFKCYEGAILIILSILGYIGFWLM